MTVSIKYSTLEQEGEKSEKHFKNIARNKRSLASILQRTVASDMGIYKNVFKN